MKKILSIALCAISISSAFADGEIRIEIKNEIHDSVCMYSDIVKIIDVDREADEVTFITYNGNMFAFYGCEDWEVGDFASVLMDGKGTKTVYDDEVISAKYVRFDY